MSAADQQYLGNYRLTGSDEKEWLLARFGLPIFSPRLFVNDAKFRHSVRTERDADNAFRRRILNQIEAYDLAEAEAGRPPAPEGPLFPNFNDATTGEEIIRKFFNYNKTYPASILPLPSFLIPYFLGCLREGGCESLFGPRDIFKQMPSLEYHYRCVRSTNGSLGSLPWDGQMGTISGYVELVDNWVLHRRWRQMHFLNLPSSRQWRTDVGPLLDQDDE